MSSTEAGAVITGRKLEVLRLMGEGMDAHAIAARLRITLHTVRGYQRDMMRKTDTHTALELVVTAMRRGIIASPRGETCVTCPMLVLADVLDAAGRHVIVRMHRAADAGGGR